MSSVYKSLASHAVIFAISAFLSRLASFLLLPLYTHCLTPADYGLVAILDPTVALLAIVLGSGMGQAVTRFHYEAKDEHERVQVWWTATLFQWGLATIVVGPLLILADSLAPAILGADVTDGATFLRIVLLQLWVNFLSFAPSTLLLVNKRSILLSILALLTLLINVGLNVAFLVYWKWGVLGLLTGNLITTIAASFVPLALFVRNYPKPAFCTRLLRRMFSFGTPLVVTSLLMMIMQEGDRFILLRFHGLAVVGVYALATKATMAVRMLVLMPFTNIWAVSMYDIAKQPDFKTVFCNIFEYVTYCLLAAMLFASVFGKLVFTWMAPEAYEYAAYLIPICCLGLVLQSFDFHFKVPALLKKQTRLMIPTYCWATAAMLASNLALQPWLGSVGAALSAVVTYGTFAFVGLARYRRIDVYPYPFGRVAAVTGGMIATYFVCITLQNATDMATWTLAVSALICTAWPAVLLAPLARHAFPKTAAQFASLSFIFFR